MDAIRLPLAIACAAGALVLGVASIAGAAVGVQVATSLSDDVLQRLFALLLLAVAGELAWQCRRPSPYRSPP